MTHPAGHRPRHAGFIAVGTLLVAALSALVLATACHTGTAAAAGLRSRESSSTDCVAACSLGTMPALMPFDEHFYTPPVDGDED